MNAPQPTSTRPYLIRAIHEWCTDNGYTPHIAVRVDETVQVPREFVQNGEIVLNVSYDATGAMQLGNDYIQFKARFGGVARDIVVPVSRVMAIYARENGQGMALPPEPDAELPPPPQPKAVSPAQAEAPAKVLQLVSVDNSSETAADEEPPEPPKPVGGARPALKRVK